MATKKKTTPSASKAAAPKASKPKSTPVKKTASTSKPKAKDKPAAKEPKAPGVIATIIEVLSKATKTKPATKADLLDVLVERFPDRTEEAMSRTISCQVPTRLVSEKGLKVQTNGERPAAYWIA